MRPPPKPGAPLTKMQAWYVECLKMWTERHGRPPCIQELAGWLNKSRTACHSALIGAEYKGVVRRDEDHKFRLVEP